ncbi:MAG TPA: hypothetical protein VK550_11895 [Polyangiaceae bacterium]|nr:hypothetical protein [Polyangiaceae bacterium]
MRPTFAVVAAVAATALLLLGSAAAQIDEEPVRLEYHAPTICEDEVQFFARARSRAPRMRMARPGEHARVFVVDIEQRGGRTSGRLTVRNPEGRQTVREIEARDCTEAVDALALVVALAVNPRAQAQEAPPGATREADAALAPPGASSVPTQSAPNAPTNPPNSAVPPTPSTAASPVATVPASAASGADVASREAPLWSFRTGLAAWGVGAIAPEPLVGARASAEIVHLGMRLIAPSFRASLGYATREGFVVDGGTAHFAYAGSNAEICPLRIPPGGPLVLRPCIIADFGFVFAQGSDALNARGETRPWADIGGGGRLEWALGRRWGVELDAGCMFPIWRDRFLFGTHSFHRVAWVGGLVALGFVMRIP